MVLHIRKYLKKRYNYEIINGLKKGKPFTAEKQTLLKDVLAGINEEILELLLEQMYEDGLVIKDDGHTVTFSSDFIFG